MRSLILCVMVFFQSFLFAQSNFKITFHITQVNGTLISNPSVRFLNNPYVPKTESGKLVFNNVPQGKYTIIIEAEKFATLVETINVNSNLDLHRNLSSSVTTLDDIIVNAEKKETNYFKVGSSITVLDAKQIRNMRIWETSDLSGLTPNLSLSHSGDNRNVTGMRGIVTTSYEQAVATYIDGVAQFGLDTYIPQMNDIESIEILRGAQGTIFGRNAMGGVINITTKKPVNKASAYLDIQAGNNGQERYNAGFKTPLIKNKLFFGISFLHDNRDGYYNNNFTKNSFDQQSQNLAGIQLKYLLDNNWSIQADIKEYFGTNNGAFPLVGDIGELFKNPYQLSQNQVSAMKDKTANSSLVIKRKGEKVDLTLQSSRQRNYRYYENTLDADFSPASIVGIFNNYGKDFNTVNVITNELRLQSKGNSKIEWLAGIYQFLQESPTKQATVFGEDAGLFGVPDKNFSLISTNIAKNSGISAFGNIRYAISNKVTLTAGLRVDQENRKLTVRSEYEKQPFPVFVTREDTTGKTNYAAISPRIGLQYNPDEKHLTYVSYSRGFRSGGLTSIGSDPSQLPLNPFKPEYANLLEAGIKGENEAKTFMYGAAIFYNIVNNIQAPTLLLPDAVTVIKNAGKLKSNGVELEITTKPTKGLMFQYSGGFTSASYTDFKSVSNGSTVDFTGKKQIFTPASTNFLAIQYQLSLKKGEFILRGEYNHFGKQYFDFANNISQKAHGLINTRVSYRTTHFDISFWGRNLAGVKYIDYAYDFGAAHLGDPRSVGFGIGYRL
jgi:iron complex outermembrane receptor protein